MPCHNHKKVNTFYENIWPKNPHSFDSYFHDRSSVSLWPDFVRIPLNLATLSIQEQTLSWPSSASAYLVRAANPSRKARYPKDNPKKLRESCHDDPRAVWNCLDPRVAWSCHDDPRVVRSCRDPRVAWSCLGQKTKKRLRGYSGEKTDPASPTPECWTSLFCTNSTRSR